MQDLAEGFAAVFTSEVPLLYEFSDKVRVLQ
jgi:hypothetical protein